MTPKRRPATGITEIRRRLLGDASVRREGFEAKTALSKDKRYRCPHCEGWVEANTVHVVAFPVGCPGERRHWHRPCWGKSVR